MRKELLWSAMLAAAMMVGCDNSDTTTPSQPPKPKNPPPTPTATDSMKDASKSAADSAKDEANKAMEATKDATKDAAEKTGEATKDAAATTAPAAGGMNAMASDAQAKLDQVITYIKDNKLDAADKTLKELESHKDSLPATVASELPTIRKQLDAAKATGGMLGGNK